MSLISLIGPDNPATFRFNGAELAAWLIEYCALQPDGTVLDVGSGAGRVAIQLMNYLSPTGAYRGFDLLQPCVEWCQQSLTTVRPNFQFAHADVHSPLYNPTGTQTSEHFRFPYEDGSFDVVLLSSVFTHMLPGAVTHYVEEIRRVLKPGGRVLVTFYLLDDEVRRLMQTGRSRQTHCIDVEPGVYAVANVNNPEGAVAYEKRYATDLWSTHGFVVQGVYPGKWPGRLNSYSGQDIVIARVV